MRCRGDKMTRNELAKELNVRPWDIDSWLLLGCPAEKFRTAWEFDLKRIKIWIENEKINVRRIPPWPLPIKPIFGQRWLRNHCPICIDRGFQEEEAGRVYTLGEVSGGRWNLRRTGIPCGHSADLNIIERDTLPRKRNPEKGNASGRWKPDDSLSLKRKKSSKSSWGRLERWRVVIRITISIPVKRIKEFTKQITQLPPLPGFISKKGSYTDDNLGSKIQIRAIYEFDKFNSAAAWESIFKQWDGVRSIPGVTLFAQTLEESKTVKEQRAQASFLPKQVG